MADESVKLKDLVQSLASTMVVTSHYLDQANVDLRNQYALSGDGALASLAPPRFALDEMTIDLSFVVEEAAVVAPGRRPTEATDRVSLTDNQRQGMMKRLEDLATFERGTARFEEQSERLRANIAGAQRQEQAISRNVNKTKSEIAVLEAKLRTLSSGPFLAAMRQQVKAQITAKRAQLGAFQQTQAAARQNLSRLQTQLRGLRPPRKPAAVVAGPQPPRLVNYGGLWTSFEESYEALKTAYDEALAEFEEGRSLPRIGRFAPPATALQPALEKAGVAVTTREKAGKIRSDFDATQTALGDLVDLVAALKVEGIRVRVDPESISEAAEAARQRLRLTFRAESQETVQVEGEERDL